jgi:hypothetical protein
MSETVAETPPAESPNLEVVSSNGETEQDPNYFNLTTPIEVDGKQFNRLRINPRGILKGKSFFNLINRYQRKFPDEARATLNKYISENFLSLVLAEINQIAPEDLYKVDYGDLPLLFLQAATFHFGAGRETTTETAPKREPLTISRISGDESSSD